MLNPDDPTVRWAAFGRQVELFLESDIGVYLVKKAEKQMEEGIEEMKNVDAFNSVAVQRAQSKVKVAESIIDWLGEAISAGHQAIEELKNA